MQNNIEKVFIIENRYGQLKMQMFVYTCIKPNCFFSGGLETDFRRYFRIHEN